ncbi:MAG: SDR family NAD(P)-dependent oxidoreductase [Acidobacteria bacterium]|nr:SDR family NAD(P)-dependent oxidoreductase [Acidobacteriota bacterium]
MRRLEGKVALVTGASRGIGCAIARALLDEGAHTFLVSRRREAVRKLAAAWNAAGGRAEALSADVTREREVNRLIARVKKRSGRLDILINNAGVFTYKPFEKTTLEDWRSNIDTNLTGTFLCTRAALPLLKRKRGGHILNIISVAGREAYENCSAYCASKFGALGLSRVLAEELRPFGIRVTAILPGPVRTKMIQKLGLRVPKGRILEPEDVARTVVEALTQPQRASLEEIVLRPARGSL